MAQALAVSIPKDTIVLPSNVKFSVSGKDLIIQKTKRRVKRFKMTKQQREKIARTAKKFKWPIITSIAVGPAVLLSAQRAMTTSGIVNQLQLFARTMLEFYTGIVISGDGRSMRWDPKLMLVGWGPLVGVLAIKRLAKSQIASINRALSQAQIPLRAS